MLLHKHGNKIDILRYCKKIVDNKRIKDINWINGYKSHYFVFAQTILKHYNALG